MSADNPSADIPSEVVERATEAIIRKRYAAAAAESVLEDRRTGSEYFRHQRQAEAGLFAAGWAEMADGLRFAKVRCDAANAEADGWKSDFEIEQRRADAAEKQLAAAQAECERLRADIAGKRAVIEASKAVINGQVKDCLEAETERDEARKALAVMRESRNHYLSAWLGELLTACETDEMLLEDLRPSLSAFNEAIEARRALGKEGA